MKLDVKYLFHFEFFQSLKESFTELTVNCTEWSFSDSEKYSWSQPLLSRENSPFDIIRGILHKTQSFL